MSGVEYILCLVSILRIANEVLVFLFFFNSKWKIWVPVEMMMSSLLLNKVWQTNSRAKHSVLQSARYALFERIFFFYLHVLCGVMHWHEDDCALLDYNSSETIQYQSRWERNVYILSHYNLHFYYIHKKNIRHDISSRCHCIVFSFRFL